MKSITLVLPYPLSANRYWQTRVMGGKSNGGRAMATTYVSSEAKAYRKQVQACVRAAGIEEPIMGRVQIEIWLYPNRPVDYRTRQRKYGVSWDDTVLCLDLDNVSKVLLDSLKNLAIEDDKFVRRLTSQRMEPDCKPARVVVRITSIDIPKPQLELEST